MSTMPVPKLSFVQLTPKPDPVHGIPCARSSHGLSVIKNGTCLVLYGGEHVARTPIGDADESATTATTDSGGGSGNGVLWVATRPATTDDDAADEWQWNRITATATAATLPPPRVAHAQAAVKDDSIYIFGGRAGISMEEQAMNDLWKLTCAGSNKDEWTFEQVVGTTGSIPSKRSFHKMVAGAGDDDHHLYVFGGCGEEGRLNDLYRFNVQTKVWTCLGTSPILRGRGGANLVSIKNNHNDDGDAIAIIAGFAGEETKDGHIYHIKTDRWSDSGMELTSMRPRSVCVSGCVGNKYAIIFGGEVDPSERGHEGAGGFENDVVVLDATAHCKYVDTLRPEPRPAPRGWADGAVHGNSLYIFGGLSGDDATPTRLNDLWRLDVEP